MTDIQPIEGLSDKEKDDFIEAITRPVYYFDTVKKQYFDYVRLWRRRENRRWWQREFILVDEEIFIPAMDGTVRTSAEAMLARYKERQQEVSDYSAQVAEYRNRKTPL